MSVAPRRNLPPGLRWRLLLGLLFLGRFPHCSLADDAQNPRLPPLVERTLRWLPEDTETLFVARAVTLPVEPKPGDSVDWQDVGVGFATEGFDVGGGKHSTPLRGRKIECLIHGAKNFKSVSSFGSLRSEGCTILVFETPLGDAAREWTESLRKEAKSTRTLVGREVFVFPSTTVMEPWIKETPWQGTYFTLLNSSTLICASSERYLESVLQRAKNAPDARAFPDNLPEWKHVDFNAPVWMLRHIPKVGRKGRTIGLTASFTKQGFRVVYIPKVGSEQDLPRLKQGWNPRHGLDDQQSPDQIKVERGLEGAGVVSSVGTPSDVAALWYCWLLYWIQGLTPIPPSG